MDEVGGNTTTNQQTSESNSVVNDYRKHLWDALRAGQEQYDKYLLTLSSGGLAISLMLLKDVFGKTQLVYPAILICSWILFCVCILATIASFLASQKCLRRHLEKYERFIETGNDEEMKKSDPLEWLTNFLNYSSGVCFLLAIATTITFAAVNLERGTLMTKEPELVLKKGDVGSKPPTPTNNGYTAPPPPVQQQQQPKPTPPPVKR